MSAVRVEPEAYPARAPSPKPPLKWAGGKRWLVPRLAKVWARHQSRRLVEPFVGGMAVSLGLMPERALLNDANAHLINFYEWLKRGLRAKQSFVNDEVRYYRARSRFNELIAGGQGSTQEAAELFYYLNRTGFNGLCRFNRKGEFNVPFGRYSRIPYLSDFLTYRDLLSPWEFVNRDFADLAVEPDDFVYSDPPYDVEFTSYSKLPFGWSEQVRLARWLAELDVPVIASNQATQRILDLYRDLGFDVVILDAPRRISCNGDRRPAREMLASKGLKRRPRAESGR